MELPHRLADFWPHVVAVLHLLAAVLASAHAVLNKRDTRAVVLWIGFICLLPLLGPVLYLLLGINRVRRKALLLRGVPIRPQGAVEPETAGLPPAASHLQQLSEAVGRIVHRPLVPGNKVEPLVNGDAAYPAMLAAIQEAKSTIGLSTYIFDNDQNGRRFVEALRQAVERGVQVRVIVDAAGARYSVPSIIPALHHAHVPAGRFLPTLAPWRLMSMNLRNHRKIMVVDGRIGFTGGMNLREGNLVAQNPRHPVRDMHFRMEGPAVAQLQDAFAADWAFVTKEVLSGPNWFPALEATGSVVSRASPDGPDEDFEKLRWTILAALSCARDSVKIVTPYFLPDPPLVSALNLAALRGVRVEIVLPEHSNLPYVDWASRAMWWQVLERGCKIWLGPPPFDHSKLMLVDGQWSLVGSGNWDTRSLRLNFEFNLECYCPELAASLESIVQSKLQGARQVTKEEVDSRAVLIRLRDGVTRLLDPFL
ncbi:MAG TPA: phospholipase D-like domain-containing protein [Verrucomicrobiae bacterium]|nr:phospholipase D-like domain-containing protein [Verrucomicrobiae bacterium]